MQESHGYFGSERIATLRETYALQSFSREELLKDGHLLASDGPYKVYYGPIGAWPSPETRIMFVGLTPGFTQLEAAARQFFESPESVRQDEIAYSDLLRRHVAFAGTMRRNMCHMLDQIGIPEKFGVTASEQLFGKDAAEIAAATSALVFPVFMGESLKNFSGSPDLSSRPLFREMLTELLLPRLQRAPHALVIPLGLSSNSGIDYLVRLGHLQESRILRNFPHPSGGNGHRVKLFNRDKERLTEAVRAWNG